MAKKKLTEHQKWLARLDKIAKEVKGSPKCPRCKGQGYITRKMFTGNDSYDEPTYMDWADPCMECRETVSRIKRKYR